MRYLTEASITEAVQGTVAGASDARLHQLLTGLIAHLHAFVREVRLRPKEWQAAIDFLYRAGQISDPTRNEFILISDVLGLSSLVDIVNSRAGASESSVLGPFFVQGAPMLPVGGDMIGDNPGEPTVLSGRVVDPVGRPIAGALMDIWQTADNGLYDVQDPEIDGPNLRCRMVTGDAGAFRVTTVKPKPYTVPIDGPVGDLLRATGRHPWRPAHLHFRIAKDGYHELITELFVDDDPHIDDDAVFGVRDSLVVHFQRNESAEDAARVDLKAPFGAVTYEFKLDPAA